MSTRYRPYRPPTLKRPTSGAVWALSCSAIHARRSSILGGGGGRPRAWMSVVPKALSFDPLLSHSLHRVNRTAALASSTVPPRTLGVRKASPSLFAASAWRWIWGISLAAMNSATSSSTKGAPELSARAASEGCCRMCSSISPKKTMALRYKSGLTVGSTASTPRFLLSMANPASRAFYRVSGTRNLEYGVEDHVGKWPDPVVLG